MYSLPLSQEQRMQHQHIDTSNTLENRERTSYTEYEVDASAHKADEGRGDRRNVWGELHTSEEPQESEWGNPSRVMSGHSLLNP